MIASLPEKKAAVSSLIPVQENPAHVSVPAPTMERKIPATIIPQNRREALSSLSSPQSPKPQPMPAAPHPRIEAIIVPPKKVAPKIPPSIKEPELQSKPVPLRVTLPQLVPPAPRPKPPKPPAPQTKPPISEPEIILPPLPPEEPAHPQLSPMVHTNERPVISLAKIESELGDASLAAEVASILSKEPHADQPGIPRAKTLRFPSDQWLLKACAKLNGLPEKECVTEFQKVLQRYRSMRAEELKWRRQSFR